MAPPKTGKAGKSKKSSKGVKAAAAKSNQNNGPKSRKKTTFYMQSELTRTFETIGSSSSASFTSDFSIPTNPDEIYAGEKTHQIIEGLEQSLRIGQSYSSSSRSTSTCNSCTSTAFLSPPTIGYQFSSEENYTFDTVDNFVTDATALDDTCTELIAREFGCIPEHSADLFNERFVDEQNNNHQAYIINDSAEYDEKSYQMQAVYTVDFFPELESVFTRLSKPRFCPAQGLCVVGTQPYLSISQLPQLGPSDLDQESNQPALFIATSDAFNGRKIVDEQRNGPVKCDFTGFKKITTCEIESALKTESEFEMIEHPTFIEWVVEGQKALVSTKSSFYLLNGMDEGAHESSISKICPNFHNETLRDMRLSHDGHRLISTGNRDMVVKVFRLDCATHEEVKTSQLIENRSLTRGDSVSSLAWRPKNDDLVSFTTEREGDFEIYDFRSGLVEFKLNVAHKCFDYKHNEEKMKKSTKTKGDDQNFEELLYAHAWTSSEYVVQFGSSVGRICAYDIRKKCKDCMWNWQDPQVKVIGDIDVSGGLDKYAVFGIGGFSVWDTGNINASDLLGHGPGLDNAYSEFEYKANGSFLNYKDMHGVSHSDMFGVSSSTGKIDIYNVKTD